MRARSLLLLLASAVPGAARAQFVAHEAIVVPGSYAVIGNGLIDCPTAAPCDNNDALMGPIDFDPLSLGDRDGDLLDDTTMSSASTLALPQGAVIRAAYLAINGYGSSTTDGDTGAAWTSTRTADFPALFGAPASPYAEVLPYDVRPYSGGRGYHARYDVTALVTGPGQYWVANAPLPPARLGYNRLLSWTLVVVYGDGSAPKLVTIYDGSLTCINNTTVVPIGGFLTPAGGAVSALFTIVANDGYAPGPNAESIQVGARGEVEQLRDNINKMILNLRDTTAQNQEQDWLKTNLARFSGMLQGQKDLQTVSRMILSELAPLVGMQHAAILDVGAAPDADDIGVASYHGTKPHAGQRRHFHIAHHLRAVGHPG